MLGPLRNIMTLNW